MSVHGTVSSAHSWEQAMAHPARKLLAGAWDASLSSTALSKASLDSIRQLCSEVLTLIRRDVAQAEALARASLAAAEEYGDPEAIALSMRAVANVAFAMGNYSH